MSRRDGENVQNEASNTKFWCLEKYSKGTVTSGYSNEVNPNDVKPSNNS